jgi:hypothetical protein
MELRKFLGCQTDFVFLNRAYPGTGLTPACSPAFLTLGYLRGNRFKKHFKESAVTRTVTDGTFAVAFRLSGKHFDGIAIWTLGHGSTSLLRFLLTRAVGNHQPPPPCWTVEYFFLKSRFKILPVPVLGKLSTNSIERGHL